MNDTTSENKPIEQERITVYVPKFDYRRLKAKLALKGIAVSEWFRRKMKEELASAD